MARSIVQNTYNVTVPAYLDADKRIITFNFVNYHIPEAEGDKLNILYGELNSAISNRDFERLGNVLSDLQSYKTNVTVKPSRKQTVIKKVTEL